MNDIIWPDNFPDIYDMYELLQKMSNASWRNSIDFTKDDIDQWLNNFTGAVYDEESEKRLALWLLCNFTYYNEDEINHLCRMVFKSLLHELVICLKLDTADEIHNILENAYFAAMGDASESGGLLLYYFRQQSNLSIHKFYYPSAIPEDEKGIVVFIDDVTLSGDSATSFFQANLQKMKFQKAYYLTLFASQTAIDEISKYGVKVIPSTILGERERCFSDQSLIFADFPSLKEASKKLAVEYGKMLSPKNPLGHKNGQYCFGLYYNTPNNTLPIFWSSKNWNPIFLRKEKKYNDRRATNYDRFV